MPACAEYGTGDPARARAESPFGGPIAHGYLTLSLLPFLLEQILDVTGAMIADVVAHGIYPRCLWDWQRLTGDRRREARHLYPHRRDAGAQR